MAIRVYNRRPPPIERASAADRTLGGILFDSRVEGLRWLYLCRLVKLGAYRTVRRQVKVQLGPDFATKIDFYVEGEDGLVWYEDVKGNKPSAPCGYHWLYPWPTIKRLWGKYGPAPLLVTVRRRGKWHTAETIAGRAE